MRGSGPRMTRSCKPARSPTHENLRPLASPRDQLRISMRRPLARPAQAHGESDMKPSILPTAIAVAALAFAAGVATPAHAQMKEQTVTVGGAPMYPSKN